MIAALKLRLGEIPEDAAARLSRVESLLKSNFNPLQPRDQDGRWSDFSGGVTPARHRTLDREIRNHSRAQFLADHAAQERALTDYLRDTERQLRANGSFELINMRIEGLVAPFTITCAGVIAAGHRSGARATRDYLDRVARNGFSSRGLALTREERITETRLRTLADAPYE
jgi:hypothetical protein